MGVHRVLQAALAPLADTPLPASHGSVRRATPADLAPLLAVHQALFPSSYLKDSDFERALSAEDRCVLVTNDLAGYLHAKDDPEQDEVYIDYVGVAERARGQGLGHALLTAALAWGRTRGRRQASLTVREDRAAALRLYELAGFRQVSAGAHWRKEVNPTEAPAVPG
nr:GNAT family N-acetyltransferase [Aquabacterium terrae]